MRAEILWLLGRSCSEQGGPALAVQAACGAQGLGLGAGGRGGSLGCSDHAHLPDLLSSGPWGHIGAQWWGRSCAMLPAVTISSPEGFSAVPDLCWDLSAPVLKPCWATQRGSPRLPTRLLTSSTGPGGLRLAAASAETRGRAKVRIGIILQCCEVLIVLPGWGHFNTNVIT